MARLKVLVITPSATDATSYYRAWGVFKNISNRAEIDFVDYRQSWMGIGTKGELAFDNKSKQLSERLVINEAFAWCAAVRFDVAFIQRGFDQETLKLATFLKNVGLKIIYEIDDNLWEIPNSFAVKKNFPDKILQTIDELIELSDACICSTIALKQYVDSILTANTIVINNALDLPRWPICAYNDVGPVIWRGSATHVQDLKLYKREIEQMTGQIEFWGHDAVKEPPFIKARNYKHVKPLDPFMYFIALRESRPHALMFPLVNDIFNQCKSNIAWLEATMAGAVCINNQVGEFKGKGITMEQYKDMSSNELRTQHEESTQDIRANYNLTQANNKRIELIQKLVS